MVVIHNFFLNQETNVSFKNNLNRSYKINVEITKRFDFYNDVSSGLSEIFI